MALIVLNLVKRTEYKTLRQKELGDYVIKIIDSGVGPTFDPFRTILEDLKRLNDDYIAKLALVGKTGKPAKEAKDDAKKALIMQLDTYANGLDTAAMTNPAIITLAGFQHRTIDTTRSTISSLPPPSLVQLTPSNNTPGQAFVEVTCVTMQKGWNLTVEYRSYPDGEWIRLPNKSAKRFLLEGLPSDNKAKVRIMINGGSGYSTYTESNWAFII